MSKLYDDLKRKGGKEDIDSLDLFAYAAQKARSAPPPEPPPPAQPELPSAEPDMVAPKPEVSTEPVEPQPELPVAEAREPFPLCIPTKASAPVYRGLSPLTSVRPPPHEDDRRAVVIAVIAVCGLVVLGVLIVGIVRGLSSAKPPQVITVAQEPPPAVLSPGPEKAKPATVKPKPPAPAVAKPEDIGGKGMTVTAEGNEKVITFESGVFAGGTKLSRSGETMLSKVGRQLGARGKGITVTVVGCTDNVPVSGKKEYKDNKALGMLRAAEAQKVLQTSSGFPAASFKTVSYGADWSPYPNDTAANRARNRTVVLRIAGM